MYLITSCINKV